MNIEHNAVMLEGLIQSVDNGFVSSYAEATGSEAARIRTSAEEFKDQAAAYEYDMEYANITELSATAEAPFLFQGAIAGKGAVFYVARVTPDGDAFLTNSVRKVGNINADESTDQSGVVQFTETDLFFARDRVLAQNAVGLYWKTTSQRYE